MNLAELIFLTSLIIPALADMVDVDALVIGLALVGKASVVSCFCSIFIYSSEIFPTEIRTVGVGLCTFFGRVGALSAPQLLHLVFHYENTRFVHIFWRMDHHFTCQMM